MYSYFKLPKIGFIGAGKLAEVLTKGFIAAGVLEINQVWASAPTEKDTYWIRHLGCNVTHSNKELVKDHNVIVLAVKPQIMPKVLREIAPEITKDHLLLSFAAGMKLRTIQYLLPPKTRVARLMTNTPVQFREGVSSYTPGSYCTQQDVDLINKLLNSVGYCVKVKEDLVDLITGFAGGGPAYIYTVIDALANGAVQGGMNRDEALQMAAKVVLGAARMVQETKQHPGELRDAVCSGGGSTIFGIHALEKGGLRPAIIDAIMSATERSKDLGDAINETSLSNRNGAA
ncbi:pyrroline-5-carboxylate reductase 3-like [Rhopilema esculentum]|uniref:pyrroline-5-carboxylate reductase 3-like n=1 Tax=Rhopilema esculentum TaxID=499914 RepID=UPI0031D1E1DB|eukprot:gene809-10546_t